MAKRSKPAPSNEIRIVRLYDAPVKAVWDAWTDPVQVAQWWGPRGFTITHHSKDLRPGGHWSYTMHGPDGVDYPNKTLYHEVVEHQRLVYDHGGSDDRPPLFRVHVEFKELKGKTRLEMSMGFATPEIAENTREFIKKAGGNGTWDRLAEYLEEKRSGRDIFVINRSFNVPIETMYEVWTNPKHFMKWLAPVGFEGRFLREDIREGGSTHYAMSGHGTTMYGRAQYQELKRPHRIVYTQQFCDENERVTRHPLAPTWPETMRTTVTLAEEGANQTRVTIEWEVVGNATAEERATFRAGKAGMTQGWTGSLDKLDAYFEETDL